MRGKQGPRRSRRPGGECLEVRVLGEGRRAKVEGRRAKGEGRRSKGEGRRAKGEGRRAKGEGRRSKGEGRRAKGEGRRAKAPQEDRLKTRFAGHGIDCSSSNANAQCRSRAQKRSPSHSSLLKPVASLAAESALVSTAIPFVHARVLHRGVPVFSRSLFLARLRDAALLLPLPFVRTCV